MSVLDVGLHSSSDHFPLAHNCLFFRERSIGRAGSKFRYGVGFHLLAPPGAPNHSARLGATELLRCRTDRFRLSQPLIRVGKPVRELGILRCSRDRRPDVPRINEAPQIEVHLVKSSEVPGGIGEPGTSCVMPALTKAIHAVIGKRIRKLPVGQQAVMA